MEPGWGRTYRSIPAKKKKNSLSRSLPGQLVARVDLIPRTPKFREDQFRDLFTTAKVVDPPKPTLESPKQDPLNVRTHRGGGIRQRLSLLPLGLDIDSQSISPDGNWLLVTATAAGQQNLYLYSLDELSRDPAVPKQLTSTAGPKSSPQWSPDSKEVFYLESGRLQAITVETRQSRRIAVTAELDIDFSSEKKLIFDQAWGYLNEYFYDPEFHGVDWASMRSKYTPAVENARTADELRRAISLMIGELNASHLGIGAPGPVPDVSGHIGLRFERKEFEASGRFKISEVIPQPGRSLGRDQGRHVPHSH